MAGGAPAGTSQVAHPLAGFELTMSLKLIKHTNECVCPRHVPIRMLHLRAPELNDTPVVRSAWSLAGSSIAGEFAAAESFAAVQAGRTARLL